MCYQLNMFKDFLFLLFPDLCAACKLPLNNKEKIICIACEYNMPKTNYHLNTNNELSKLFYGRANVSFSSAVYLFHKEGSVQHLIHNLKYNKQQHIGKYLGEEYGKELKKTESLTDVDLIVPVPLHSKKLKQRGFNQSECFAEGIAQSMNIKMDKDFIVRKKNTLSQTNKSRFERWENVNDAFDINYKKTINQKHILLVDDVITTGSTIEACANILFEHNNNIKVSVVALAHATI
jgi:ComF family protein